MLRETLQQRLTESLKLPIKIRERLFTTEIMESKNIKLAVITGSPVENENNKKLLKIVFLGGGAIADNIYRKLLVDIPNFFSAIKNKRATSLWKKDGFVEQTSRTNKITTFSVTNLNEHTAIKNYTGQVETYFNQETPDVIIGFSIGGTATLQWLVDRCNNNLSLPKAIILLDSGPGLTEGTQRYLEASGQIKNISENPNAINFQGSPHILAEIVAGSDFDEKLQTNLQTAFDAGKLDKTAIIFIQAHGGEDSVSGPLATRSIEEMNELFRSGKINLGDLAKEMGFSDGGMFGKTARGLFPKLDNALTNILGSVVVEGANHSDVDSVKEVNDLMLSVVNKIKEIPELNPDTIKQLYKDLNIGNPVEPTTITIEQQNNSQVFFAAMVILLIGIKGKEKAGEALEKLRGFSLEGAVTKLRGMIRQ